VRRCDDHVAHDERLFDSVITYRLILRPRRADRTRPIARVVRSDGVLILLRLRFLRPAVLPDAASCQQDNNRTIQHDTLLLHLNSLAMCTAAGLYHDDWNTSHPYTAVGTMIIV
jgi:hypothetical protein